MITVNNILTNSRNPTELKYRLEGLKGKVIHSLGDGYHLIEFDALKIKESITINKKKVLRFTPLQWYLHKTDFK